MKIITEVTLTIDLLLIRLEEGGKQLQQLQYAKGAVSTQPRKLLQQM